MEIMNLSNVMSNAHWFAMQFTIATMEMGEVKLVTDEFGEMIHYLTIEVLNEKGIEFNRENAKKFIRFLADKYLHDKNHRDALDYLFLSNLEDLIEVVRLADSGVLN